MIVRPFSGSKDLAVRAIQSHAFSKITGKFEKLIMTVKNDLDPLKGRGRSTTCNGLHVDPPTGAAD